MRKRLILFLIMTFFGLFFVSKPAAATGVNLKISPVSNYFTIKAGDSQNYTMTVSNTGDEEFSFKVYTSAYSVTDEDYTLVFDDEKATNYNQITRWITFRGESGEYSKIATYKVKPGEDKVINYKINVPDNIPDGGQYCVIFAESINDKPIESSGITAITRVAMTLVGHGKGLTTESAEISDFSISHPFTTEGINVSSKIRNSGNTDFEASYVFEVKTIFGKTVYANNSNYTVLPETERKFTLAWTEAPKIGIFNAYFRVVAADAIREESHIVMIIPTFVLIIMLLLLTVIIIWVTILIKKRKERSSRLVV